MSTARLAPEVGVVIPARDAADVLPRTLEAVLAQEGVASEVVVVDNASRDATAAIATAAGVGVVPEPRPSRARARNAGVAATTAPLVAFLDADCVPRTGWLAALVACLRGGADLAGGRVDVLTGERPNAVERFDAAWRFRQEHTITHAGWAVTANLGVRRAVLERLGGLDPAYRHVGEDVDLCVRARRAGFGLVFCPGAVVAHEAERQARAVLRRAFFQGWASTQHAARLGGDIGRREWRHPRPILAGDWATRRFDIADADRAMTVLARADYAARVAGSGWAELRRAR